MTLIESVEIISQDAQCEAAAKSEDVSSTVPPGPLGTGRTVLS